MSSFALFVFLTYGIAFGLQNKVDFLQGKHPFLDRLLACTYCTGFHAGWTAWVLLNLNPKDLNAMGWGSIASCLAHALAGAASSYTLDTAVRWWEGNTPSEPEA
jgi:hypothetical protein